MKRLENPGSRLMQGSGPKPSPDLTGNSWWVRDLAIAAQFLTRLPVPPIDTGDRKLMRASWCFPVIGAAIGAIGGVVALFGQSLGLPLAASALIALAAMALITGALHEDGLSDLADGFGGGHDKAAKIAIMRDSRIGAYGVLALIVVIGLKISAIMAIMGGGDLAMTVIALVIGHAGARALIPPVTLFLENASDSGLGDMAGKPKTSTMQAALGIGAVLFIVLLPLSTALIAAATGCAAAAAVAALAQRQIGGYTGDVLGAVEQVAETAILLALAASIGA
jgi:adenosylcobinamide-GDP ribazoletransferase